MNHDIYSVHACVGPSLGLVIRTVGWCTAYHLYLCIVVTTINPWSETVMSPVCNWVCYTVTHLYIRGVMSSYYMYHVLDKLT